MRDLESTMERTVNKRPIGVGVCAITLSTLVFFWTLAAAGQAPAAESLAPIQPVGSLAEPIKEGVPPGEVVIDGRTVLTVYEPVLTLTPQDRASGIENRIIAAARDGAVSPDSIRLLARNSWTEILSDKTVIMAVTEGDAQQAGIPREQLAIQHGESIRQAIRSYRRDHSWQVILRGALYTMLATVLLLPALWLIRRLRFALRERLERRIKLSRRLEAKSTWHVLIAYLGPLALALGALLRWILIFAVLETYLAITLGLFSSTREVSLQVTRWVFSQLTALAQTALDYTPNLVVIAVIALGAYYASRLGQMLFGEIRKGDLKIRGFYPDWADPTEKLFRLLVLVLAVIVAFPYLPGAKSPAFQGISIFLGVLLSLGSSSAVANAIAGIILTYMRSFLVGHWVQIGEVTGEVIEKNLLVTRVLTPKAEIITIPNATVMSGSVKNYSLEAEKAGVIFHTTVTIGYDAPWRTVHQLLTDAALATGDVLREPVPFVLQTRLDDFYVAYELNAYTSAPRRMLAIYSELHQNIQDKFNEAGVEICSPHFSSLRDGNRIAIPEQYIGPDYQAPGFRVRAANAEKSGPVQIRGRAQRND